MHTHTHTHTHIRTYTHTHCGKSSTGKDDVIHTHTHKHTNTRTCTRSYLNACRLFPSAPHCMHVYTYMYVSYVHMYVQDDDDHHTNI